ncbi:hypothetical protein [Pseudoduganella sp.]|uniref:hypothetical protein n=1 Tax=Pseudoduganella sp. TaxID=1880898 RepID=UPI0035AD816D
MPTYVQHEVLDRIPDVFNAEAIWQAPGFALFSRRPLLRDLLERSPRELRGRAPVRCFSHIQLRLPQDDVDDDYHLTRGNRARELAETLATLHQKDFGDLLGSEEVRYDVAGDEQLAPGEIAVRFGHAVYLPAGGEKALFNIATSRDGAVWKPACAVYAGQRLALLGGAGGLPAPGWPFGDQGGVLLVNDGPESDLVVQVRPKEALDCVFDASLGAYALCAKGGHGPRLLLKVTRAAGAPRQASSQPPAAPATPASQAAPAVWQPRSGPAADETALPQARPAQPRTTAGGAMRPGESDATFAPGALQRLTLVALAIPRLSLYRSTGALALHIPFAPGLAIGRNADAERALTVIAGADDTLCAVSAAGRQAITLPAALAPGASPGRTIQLQPAPDKMRDRYLALLTLPQPLAMPLLPGGALEFGRSMPALSALRVLDQPWMLEAATPSSPDRLGLSRKAFSCEAGAQGLAIRRLSESQVLYRLDAGMQLLGPIGDEGCLLEAGQHLVAGSYVLRYEG